MAVLGWLCEEWTTEPHIAEMGLTADGRVPAYLSDEAGMEMSGRFWRS